MSAFADAFYSLSVVVEDLRKPTRKRRHKTLQTAILQEGTNKVVQVAASDSGAVVAYVAAQVTN